MLEVRNMTGVEILIAARCWHGESCCRDIDELGRFSVSALLRGEGNKSLGLPTSPDSKSTVLGVARYEVCFSLCESLPSEQNIPDLRNGRNISPTTQIIRKQQTHSPLKINSTLFNRDYHNAANARGFQRHMRNINKHIGQDVERHDRQGQD